MSQHVVVTGGFGALGRAVAAAFLTRGGRVALLDHGEPPIAPPSPRTYWVSRVDLARSEDALAAFDQARLALDDRVDVLVNCAGAFRLASVAGGSVEDWREMFAVNLLTASNMCRAAAYRLADGGAIVNVGAASADRAGVGVAAYAAAKAGVARLTESLAAELCGRIRVNAVLPGILDTPANRAAMPEADRSAWTAPEAVADAICWLSSPNARAVNGALIPVTNPCAISDPCPY